MSMVFGMSEWVKLTDRIRELEAQLAEARAEIEAYELKARNAGLEDAAKVADSCRRDECSPGFIADRIRALKTVTPPTE